MVAQELEIKKRLLQECTKILNTQIEAAKNAMDDAQESANEHQGAIEDKFESFREACQIQRDMYAKQLDEAMSGMAILKRLNATKENQEIMLGTVVETNDQTFFIALSFGQINVDDKPYFAISAMSPMFKAMAGKKKGDSFSFRDKEFKIKKMF